ncbi:MAG: DEAD/DEAH box helicase [Parachlamydiaceae bacterium]
MKKDNVLSFADLNLHPSILEAIRISGYTTPTPIQSQAIPKIKSRIDLRASAQTGTGKTGAFLLPTLDLLTTPAKQKGYGPRVLILVPTRELAMQVAAEAKKYSSQMQRVRTVCIYGGAPYPVQNRELSRPFEILVATPGRLIDHMERGRIDFSRLEMLILDEADRMLDMGFIEPVEQIAAATPKTRQTLLFSATFKGEVLELSKRLLNEPEEITIAQIHEKHENIEQRLHYVDNINHKHQLLDHLLKDPTINQVIVFTSTKMNADQLVDTLYDQGHRAAALHGDMNQRQRTRTIAQLRRGEIRILVATDVAARGIDVQTITHVINFDLPNCAEDYVHRIGRTGRAGAKGIALSFAGGRDIQLVRRIEQLTGQKLEAHLIAGLEPKTRPPTSRYPSDAPTRGRRGDSSRPYSNSRGNRDYRKSENRFKAPANLENRTKAPTNSENRFKAPTNSENRFKAPANSSSREGPAKNYNSSESRGRPKSYGKESRSYGHSERRGPPSSNFKGNFKKP